MPRHWLSFCDSALPKGSQFLGVAIVDADNFIGAVLKAHELGINPGGECLGVTIDEGDPEHAKLEPFLDKLNTRADLETVFDDLITADEIDWDGDEPS